MEKYSIDYEDLKFEDQTFVSNFSIGKADSSKLIGYLETTNWNLVDTKIRLIASIQGETGVNSVSQNPFEISR